MLCGGSRSCFCVRFMRDEVGANVQEQKPIRNPYRHQKTSKNSYRQVALRYGKENLLSVGAQWAKSTSDNKPQQEKATFEELVRMRSPVQIWVAAPQSLENFGFRGFFVAIFDFLVWVKMWVSWLTHTVTHTRKGLKSAGREGCASCPAFSLPYMTCAMKFPMVAAASSCFCRVAWV